ncbi:MAG: D-sedoheptulose 7-phosphate isomerase [Bacteroidia bacterium]
MKEIREHLNEAAETLQRFVAEESNLMAIEEAGEIIASALKNGNGIYSCGNGGSMCDAMHFAEELTGRFRDNRRALAATAIADPSHISCVSNDYGYEHIFSRYIEAWGREGDVLLGISTSGNSANVVNAIEAAKKKGMKVIGLTGKGGGQMSAMCDVEVRAPETRYSDRAQEIHIKVIHILIDLAEKQLIAG